MFELFSMGAATIERQSHWFSIPGVLSEAQHGTELFRQNPPHEFADFFGSDTNQLTNEWEKHTLVALDQGWLEREHCSQ